MRRILEVLLVSLLFAIAAALGASLAVAVILRDSAFMVVKVSYQLAIIPVIASLATAFILLVTAVFVYYYARETKALRRLTWESNIFNGLVAIHNAIGSDKSRQRRAALNGERFYPDIFKRTHAALKVSGVPADTIKKIVIREGEPATSLNLTELRAALAEAPTDAASRHERLRTFYGNNSARKAVDDVLTDFNFIALPLQFRLKAAEAAAAAYKHVIQRTVPRILPFIAVEYLLGGQEPEIRKFYIDLLKFLELVEKDFEITDIPELYPTIPPPSNA